MTPVKIKSNMNLFLIFLLSSCINNDTAFYNKVLNDFDRYSYFIAIDLKSSEYNGYVIIENDDLFYFLNQTKTIDKNEFKTKTKKILENHSFIDIGNISLSKWNFIKVPKVNNISQHAKKGIEAFLKIYFNGKVLKDGITSDERSAIIYQLFEWKIPSKIDDETGYLIISGTLDN